MRAAVQQIFTLEIERGAGAFGEILTFGQRCRTPGVVFKQVGKLRLKLGVALGADERLFQLTQGGHQDLRHVHAAKFAKIGV